MLFGHQNDDTNQPAPGTRGASGVNPLAVDPATGVSLPVPPAPDEPTDSTAVSAPLVTPSPAPVVEPTEPAAATDAPASPVSSLDDDPEPAVAPSSQTQDDQTSDDDTTPAGDDDLLSMKQQALSQLSPLVGQLDQTAEEKFRTTMMLIQSTDNQSLLKDAYAAAQRITDEKARAQALLDVVNEINYFTQQKS